MLIFNGKLFNEMFIFNGKLFNETTYRVSQRLINTIISSLMIKITVLLEVLACIQ